MTRTRGNKVYDKAQVEYDKALQLFPNYADAVFNLGILYLDADKIPNMDLFAKENTAIQYLQKYKQMMTGSLPPGDPTDAYIAEAQDDIKKEEKRLERIKKQQERDAARAAKKTADDAKKAAAGGTGGGADGTAAAPTDACDSSRPRSARRSPARQGAPAAPPVAAPGAAPAAPTRKMTFFPPRCQP